MTTPADIVAIVDQSIQAFWIYYITQDGFAAFIQGPSLGVKESTNPAYSNTTYIKFAGPLGDGSYAQGPKGNSKIAVVDYKTGDNTLETRVYYVNTKGLLNEARWTGGKNENHWYPGALNNLSQLVEPGSPLTAAVDGVSVRIYFQKQDTSSLWVAYTVTDEDAWTPKAVVNKFT